VATFLRYRVGLFGATQPAWNSLWALQATMHVALFPALAVAGAYRTPCRWRLSDAQPAVTRALLIALPVTTALLYLLRLGATRSGLVLTPSRAVALMAWVALLFGLTGLRVGLGRLQRALYARGLGLRRALILGPEPEAARVAERIAGSPWLGEQVVGALAVGGSGSSFERMLERLAVDVVWLAPPEGAEGDAWLPARLFDEREKRLLWRMLPDDFARFSASGLAGLNERARELYFRRVRHGLTLPRLRVAFLGSRGAPANYGGVETYVEEVGSHLAALGARVAVYCHARYVAARGVYRGMELRTAPAVPSKHLETISHTALATLDVLLHADEVVHYQALGPATLAWLPRLLGRKVVVTVQGLDWQRAKWGRLARAYLRLGEWAAATFPHRTIVVSQVLAEHFAERHGRETTLIPNGFSRPAPQPPRLIRQLGLERDSYVLFVGRLVPEKGCHTLVEAFARVTTDKQLVLAGRADHADGYNRRLAALAERTPGVRLVGFQQGQALAELYTNAYLVAHPSEMEGLSITLLEAISYGNCLLVSDIPENLEATQGASARFRAGSVDDLARQLQRLLDHPEEVEALRARVRAHLAAYHDWAAVAEATLAVYEELVG